MLVGRSGETQAVASPDCDDSYSVMENRCRLRIKKSAKELLIVEL